MVRVKAGFIVHIALDERRLRQHIGGPAGHVVRAHGKGLFCRLILHEGEVAFPRPEPVIRERGTGPERQDAVRGQAAAVAVLRDDLHAAGPQGGGRPHGETLPLMGDVLYAVHHHHIGSAVAQQKLRRALEPVRLFPQHNERNAVRLDGVDHGFVVRKEAFRHADGRQRSKMAAAPVECRALSVALLQFRAGNGGLRRTVLKKGVFPALKAEGHDARAVFHGDNRFQDPVRQAQAAPPRFVRNFLDFNGQANQPSR